MKNWTISRRLTLGFSILIVVVLCFGALTWFQMTGIGGNLATITHQTMPALEVIGDLRFEAAQLRVINLKHVMYDTALKVDLEKQALEEENVLSGLITKCETYQETPEQKALFVKVPPVWQAYRAETGKLRQASTQNNAEAVKALLASAGKIGNEFLQALDALSDLNTKQSEASSRKIESAVASSKRALLFVSLLVVGLGVTVSILIGKSISRILQRLVGELNAGAEQTVSAAGHVSASSQSLAEGASEQAASLEETSSSLEEMSGMTKRNAENAQKANELAKQARNAAEKGAGDMQAMSTAMEAIKVSSDDIAKIIKTIDEIAFQTNILALNAAVEAARAGEAGMGFAVVADEVRNLAQRSAQAAKETTDKIEGAIGKTAQGVEISTKVGQALNEIVAKARQVDELVSEVASASREQTQGISQINTAVSQMDKVTQSNAASAEESAAAAEQLNAQAEIITQSVGELLKLVGGQQQGSAPSTQAVAPMRKSSATIHGHARTPQTGHLPVAARKRVITPVSMASTARSEIPLEGDFKNF
jgi:methyl-accepting chemotaxis protein